MNKVQFIVFLLELALVAFALVNLGGIMTWVERKEGALVQDRIGANRAGFKVEGVPLAGLINFLLAPVQRLGLLHPLADGIKMFAKENFTPQGAHLFFYRLAPFLAVMPALLTFMVVPFGPDVTLGLDNPIVRFANWLPFGMDVIDPITVPLQVLRLDGGMLYIFAFAGLGVYSAAIAGWASSNKFALLGSIRASAQMISYEISMGLSLIGLFMIFETLQLNTIVEQQGDLLFGFLPAWGIFLQPLSFFLFFTAAIAETKRAPFDLAEGESEIVAGYFLEYSGMHFGAFFMAEFIEIIVVAGIVSTLFFGGWQVPYLADTGFVFPGGTEIMFGSGWVTTLRIGSFVTKVFFFAWLQVLLRWSLPRFRFDQVIALGWKIMFPAALANLVLTAFVLAMMG